MTKDEAIKLIDDHKNKLINPVEMLAWTYLRVIILKINDDSWLQAEVKANEILAR